MKIDDIFLLYENNDKYFPTYELAYFNSKRAGSSKRVNYVFTPTMAKYKRVCEIEKACRDYFNEVIDCDFYNIFNKTGYKQLQISEV